MSDCIFCKIINGDLPSYKIYEDADTYVFLDNAKKHFGHTLVVPKKHYVNTLDCDTQILKAVISTVQKVAKHYVDHCDIGGVLIMNANNECAGQVVGHLHYHIIPHGDTKNRGADMDLKLQQEMLRITK